ncbi:MAG: signal recognition particle-docking protein FtsY [Candidatus Pacearchaeota archaeon]
MFGSLKEKLKKWISKTKETQEVEKPVKIEKKPPKKEKIAKKVDKKEPKITSKEKPIIEETKPEEQKEEKKSFFSRFQKKLSEEEFKKIFEELELILLQNNTAYEVVDSIRSSLKEKIVGKNLKEVDLSKELKSSIKETLINPPDFLKEIKESLKEKTPFVILFAGINGSGKTTTIAKLANYLIKNKLSVCLCAADTFRAASIEQIQQHADNLKVPLIKKDYGADPAAVGFDAIAYAKKHHIDIVLIDTAGRMQNKDSLMKEIEKVVRVNKPDMKFFVGESITGNDAVEQAKTFNEVIDLTGIILSKADVDEKGGTAISVSHVTKKPIYFLGTGQEYKDLEVFNKDNLIEKIGL